MIEQKLAKIFKALGEPTRLKILKLLFERSLCVCELAEVLEMSQPRISQHLKHLKDVELVITRRVGSLTYHDLNYQELDQVLNSLNEFLQADMGGLEGYKDIKNKIDQLEPK